MLARQGASSDDTISRTIAKVRSLARGAMPAPFTIETLPKVGYRLVETRKTVTGVNAEDYPEPSAPLRSRRSDRLNAPRYR